MDSHFGVKPPDPPLQTQEQAGIASLTVTPNQIDFFSPHQTHRHSPPTLSVSRGCFLTHGPDVAYHRLCTLAQWRKRIGCEFGRQIL